MGADCRVFGALACNGFLHPDLIRNTNSHTVPSRRRWLQSNEDKINEIKKTNKPVIVCCLSGMRSAQATSILKQNNIEVINGGGWKSLESKL